MDFRVSNLRKGSVRVLKKRQLFQLNEVLDPKEGSTLVLKVQ